MASPSTGAGWRKSRRRSERLAQAARINHGVLGCRPSSGYCPRSHAVAARPPSRRCQTISNGCTRTWFLSNSSISRNSRSARSASASSKGRSCRHCSDRRKSQADRNSASRHRTRNNLGLDRYTKDAGRGAPCAKPKLSGRKLEGCYSVADDSPAGSRSRASVAPAGYEPAQPARRPAAAIGRQQSTETRGAT
jgi:hypothetical protein